MYVNELRQVASVQAGPDMVRASTLLHFEPEFGPNRLNTRTISSSVAALSSSS